MRRKFYDSGRQLPVYNSIHSQKEKPLKPHGLRTTRMRFERTIYLPVSIRAQSTLEG